MKQRNWVNWLFSGLIVSLFTAPAQQVYGAKNQPDLKRLYEVSVSDRFQNPVIVIHGVFGARILP